MSARALPSGRRTKWARASSIDCDDDVTGPDPDVGYEVVVKGFLDLHWSEWLGGFDIRHIGQNTVISGRLRDQAALHGLINRLRDLDLFLVSVRCVDGDDSGHGGSPADGPDHGDTSGPAARQP